MKGDVCATPEFRFSASGVFLPMLAAVFAGPLRAGSSGGGNVLRVVQLNVGDRFGGSVPREVDAGPGPGGAPIDGVKQGAARAACPNIVAEGGYRPEFDAVGNVDLLEGFPSVRRALHFTIRCNAPKGSRQTSAQFELLVGCLRFDYGRLGRHSDGSHSGYMRRGFRSGGAHRLTPRDTAATPCCDLDALGGRGQRFHACLRLNP
jgi:hypothetical protein